MASRWVDLVTARECGRAAALLGARLTAVGEWVGDDDMPFTATGLPVRYTVKGRFPPVDTAWEVLADGEWQRCRPIDPNAACVCWELP